MIVLLETDLGFISHRYIIRLDHKEDANRWLIRFQEGNDVREAHCTNEQAEEFFGEIRRGRRVLDSETDSAPFPEGSAAQRKGPTTAD